jgi:hypothetical protein
MDTQTLPPNPPPACACMTAPGGETAAANRACRSERLWTALSARWQGLCRDARRMEPEAR